MLLSPSPKYHFREVISPCDVSANETVSGTNPAIGSTEKPAMGGGMMVRIAVSLKTESSELYTTQ